MGAGRRRRALVGIVAAVLLFSPAVAGAAECEGDECQAPPAAPDDPTPPTAAVNGPPNPPVHFPKPRKHRHHPKHHRHTHRGGR